MDIAIVNGTVVDGTGAAPVRADIGIVDDRIVAVGQLGERAGRTIDVSGKVVAPGFIDAHAHSDFAGLLDVYESEGVTPNLKSLAGQGTIRMAVMGMESRPADGAEMAAMRGHLRNAMEAGALGVSTGLMYPPGSFAGTDELIELTKVVADYGGLYASHIRNEDDDLLDSMREAIRIGEEAGVPVQIAHHKASGKRNWGKVERSLAILDEARAAGLEIDSDAYPYTAFSTMLGPMLGEFETFPDTPVLIVSTRFDHSLIGRYFHDVASEREQSLLECAEQINETEKGAVTVVGLGMCQEDVDTVLRHSSTMVGSDGAEVDSGTPHPRTYGTFARVLGDCADLATYEQPRRHPSGIEYVLINGRIAVDAGVQLEVRPGRVLRHGAGQ